MRPYQEVRLRRAFEVLGRLRRNPRSLATLAVLHEELLTGILMAERGIRRAKKDIKSCAAAFAQGGRCYRSPEEVDRIRCVEGRAVAKLNDCRLFALGLRTIGDGIAFTYLDSWDIKPLSEKQHAGSIGGKAGLKRELLILRHLHGKGIPAILNDLTTCLRHGDITAIGPEMILIEVKGTSKGPRARRQRDATEGVLRYLESGKKKSTYPPGGTVIRTAPKAALLNHQRTMRSLLKRSRPGTTRFVSVEPGLVYTVFRGNPQLSTMKRIGSKVGALPLVFPLSTAEWLPAYTPAPLLFPDSETWIHWLTGRVAIMIALDRSRVSSVLGQHGVGVRFHDGGEWYLEIQPTSAAWDGPLLISASFFARIAYDCLSLSSVLDHLTGLAVDGPPIELFELEEDESQLSADVMRETEKDIETSRAAVRALRRGKPAPGTRKENSDKTET